MYIVMVWPNETFGSGTTPREHPPPPSSKIVSDVYPYGGGGCGGESAREEPAAPRNAATTEIVHTIFMIEATPFWGPVKCADVRPGRFSTQPSA